MVEKFNSNEYLLNALKNSKQKKIKIIALFALAKKIKFENKEQAGRFIRRHLRPAKELDCYSLDRIRDVLLYLLKEYNGKYKVGLETVLKYIDEDIDSLSGTKPIITLKSGEKIYDTTRIEDLERAGKIRYKNNRWVEIL